MLGIGFIYWQTGETKISIIENIYMLAGVALSRVSAAPEEPTAAATSSKLAAATTGKVAAAAHPPDVQQHQKLA